jgi:hypothetical protein
MSVVTSLVQTTHFPGNARRSSFRYRLCDKAQGKNLQVALVVSHFLMLWRERSIHKFMLVRNDDIKATIRANSNRAVRLESVSQIACLRKGERADTASITTDAFVHEPRKPGPKKLTRKCCSDFTPRSPNDHINLSLNRRKLRARVKITSRTVYSYKRS